MGTYFTSLRNNSIQKQVVFSPSFFYHWFLLFIFSTILSVLSPLQGYAQSCDSQTSGALAKWTFDGTSSCNGAIGSPTLPPYYKLLADLYKYCPSTNSGCGQALLGSKGHVNTTMFTNALCVSDYFIGMKPTPTTWDYTDPEHFYITYIVPKGKPVCITGFSLNLMINQQALAQIAGLGITILQNGNKISEQTIIPTVGLNSFDLTSNQICNDGKTDVTYTIYFGLWRIDTKKRSSYSVGFDDLTLIGTCGGMPIPTIAATQATCGASGANSNGIIQLTNFESGSKFYFNTGSTYTGTKTYATATAIPTTGIISSTLPNPSTNQVYTVRVFSATCYRDVQVTLKPTPCNSGCIQPTGMVLTPVLATCTGMTVNNDARIQITGITNGDKVGFSLGSTYTGVAYSTAQSVTGGAYTFTNIANPANSTQDYTVRIYNGDNTCYIDKIVSIAQKTCACVAPTAITLSATPATCSTGITANNDAKITVSGVSGGDKVGISTGNIYTGTAYTSAQSLVGSTYTFIGLANPSGSQIYTIRVFNASANCFIDKTITLNEKVCNSCAPPYDMTLTPTSATCAGTLVNKDASIAISGVLNGDKVGISLGNTYSGTTYTTSASLSSGAYTFIGLTNPVGSQVYTIRVYNGSSSCFTDKTVTLTEKICATNCTKPSSASLSIVAATCTGNTANIDAKVFVTAVVGGDKVGISVGSTYTGPVYSSAQSLTSGAYNFTGLSNPTNGNQVYTVRIFNGANDCYLDKTITLTQTLCTCIAPTGTTVTPTGATCTGSNANTDAKIAVTGVTRGTKVGLSIGNTYTGVAYATAQTLTSGAYTFTGLENPAGSQVYTIRVYNGSDSCYVDKTVTITEILCPPACVKPTNIKLTPTPNTCIGALVNADGKITVSGVTGGDKVGISTGSTYTGVAYGAAQGLVGGIYTFTNLVNPTGASQTYTIRVYNGSDACYTDRTEIILKTLCACIPPTGLNTVVSTATCTETSANADAKISVSGIIGGDKVGISAGNVYTGAAYASANSLSLGAYTFTGLINPTGSQIYTMRVYNGSDNCYMDKTVILNEVVCGNCANACVEVLSAGTDVIETVSTNNKVCFESCKSNKNIDLALSMSVSPTTGTTCGSQGTNFVYLLTLKNTGSMTATNIQVSNLLPSGLILVSSSPSAPIYTESAGWLIPSLDAGASTTLTLTTRALVAGTYNLTAQVQNASPLNDPNSTPGNNVTTEDDYTMATITVTGNNSPSISKEFSPWFAKTGTPFRLMLKLINNESTPTALTQDFVDVLPISPAQMVVATTPNLSSLGMTLPTGGVTAISGGTSIIIPKGTILAPGLNQVLVDVNVPNDGYYTNIITSGSLQTTAGGNCLLDSASISITSTNNIPPMITKSFANKTASTNTDVLLTITIENRNATSMTLDEAFYDIFPHGLVLGAGSNTGTCTGVAAFAAGDSVLSVHAGTVIPVGTSTIIVPVRSATARTYCNTILNNAMIVTINAESGLGNRGLAQDCINIINTPCTVIGTATITSSVTGTLNMGNSTKLTLNAAGLNTKSIVYWNSSHGAFTSNATTNEIIWTAPKTPGTYTISAVVDNTLTGYGICSASTTYLIMVVDPSVFDLALTKTLTSGQASTVASGATVTFNVDVINQGNVDATNVQLTDYIPMGLTLNDPAWTAVGGKASLNTLIPSILAGQTVTRAITFTVNSSFSGTITNSAEISAATGGTDIDSSPDSDNINDGTPKNDVVTENHKTNPLDDEDDSDVESLSVVSCTNANLAASVVMSPTTIRSQSDVVQVTYALVNKGGIAVNNVTFNGKVTLFNRTGTSTKLTLTKQGDTGNDGIMLPNEAWIYTGTFTNTYSPGDVFVVTGEANGLCGGVSAIKAATADLVYTVGVNMDVQIVDTCYKAGGTMKVDLITRLLIDEDMALNSGNITVGGLTILLPKRHFEGRDLMITVNNGLAFNPFNPPAGITIIPFVDQIADKGRNTNNVLDESDPINSIGNPCTAAGQNDISCEFPDWVFRMEIPVPTNQTGNKVSVTASDAFNLFQSVENPVGSGLFDAFVDITPSTGAGGVKSDSTSLCVNNCVLTKPTINTIILTPATCNASTVNNNAKINIKGILNGSRFSWGTDTTIFSFTNATTLMGDSISITGLVNPSQATVYYFRIYNNNGCYVTTSTLLKTTTCNVCQGVTYTICPGESYSVTAPIGTTGIQWYRNGVVIPAPLGTTTNLVVSSIGEYTFTSTSNGSSCIDSLCCPVKVIAGNCCSKPTFTRIIATNATCNGSVMNNDASIDLTGVLTSNKYAVGTDKTLLNYISAKSVTGSAIRIGSLANPNIPIIYYIRLYNGAEDCYTETSIVLNPTACPIPCKPVCLPIGFKRN